MQSYKELFCSFHRFFVGTLSFLVICWQAQQSVFIARLASQVKLMRALMVVVHETLGLFLKAPLAAGVNASLKSFFH
jgi:hypothetical protein